MKTPITIPTCSCGAEAKLSRSPTGLTTCVACTKCNKRTDWHCMVSGAIQEWAQKVKTR